MKNKKSNQLTLIGAGPGDPELMTIKGVLALGKADVVLYDALVNPELLQFVPAGVPKHLVGKRKSQHSFTQDEINSFIVKLAKDYTHIVRLKGGDPFVFGRGYEELEYAALYGIKVEYIPGISSSISVPGLCGIPVTHRGSSESFWVITATTAKGDLARDFKLAAQSNATLVILMGLSKLSEIVAFLSKYKPMDYPIAVIQNGSLPNQKQTIGNLSNIVSLVTENHMGAPAIIVAGEVVKLPYSKQKIDNIVNSLQESNLNK